jgi:lipopolysaccharide/colanic/teichoic acid biosynthesis glycosyltransferase
LDIIVSLISIILLLPIFVVIAILIKLDTKGPIFYIQQRVGRDFKKFGLYKFRTMVVNADKIGPLVTKDRDPRITRVGYYLRKWKLDELPQFFNVLKGDMSLVGPRPEVERYIDLFRDEYKVILSIKPGITDYATIHFRDEEDIIAQFEDVEKGYTEIVLPKKIELYKKYIEEISLMTDIKILFLTFLKVLRV